MADEPKRDGGRGCAVAIAWGIALLPVLYVLGVGPASLAWSKSILPTGAYRMLYDPLFRVSSTLPSVKEALGWYINLWVILP